MVQKNKQLSKHITVNLEASYGLPNDLTSSLLPTPRKQEPGSLPVNVPSHVLISSLRHNGIDNSGTKDIAAGLERNVMFQKLK